MYKILFLLPAIFLLTACSTVKNYINKEQTQRLDKLDERFAGLEEKVDALLAYNNKTYDIMVDNEIRLQELEKDARKRGVPVPQRNIDVTYLKQVPTPHSAPIVQANNQVQNTQVGALSGQDLTKTAPGQNVKEAAKESSSQNAPVNPVQVPEKQKVVEAPKQAVTQASKQALSQTANQAQKQGSQPIPAQQKQVEQAAPLQKVQSETLSPANQQAGVQTAASSQANAPKTDSPANLSSNDLYKKAYSLYQQREYALAENTFDEFLAKYPQDVLAPNALYWKGETLYARAIYPQAIFAFKEVQTRYPKHPKTADSLLKTAMSYSRLGDKENASLHYLVLVEDWPNSTAAQKARSLGQ